VDAIAGLAAEAATTEIPATGILKKDIDILAKRSICYPLFDHLKPGCHQAGISPNSYQTLGLLFLQPNLKLIIQDEHI